MIGVVLAAGVGRRLGPLTAALPKTLLPVDGVRTPLDLVLANLAAVGIEDVVVVVGHAADEVERRRGDLEARHGVRLRLIVNDRFAEWNNCFSLWLAREALADGALVVNGDTVHPAAFERALLDAPLVGDVLLAVDTAKVLGAEEMKVELDPTGRLDRIGKGLDPHTAHGEYVGLTLVRPSGAGALATALETTWRRDPGLYYEDAYAALAATGAVVGVPVPVLDWVEVDDAADLARARTLVGGAGRSHTAG